MRVLSIFTMIFFLFATSGCSFVDEKEQIIYEKIVSPADSYVCYTSSGTCSVNSMPERWSTHYKQMSQSNFSKINIAEMKSVSLIRDKDIQCGRLESKELNYKDNQFLSKLEKSCVVFSSPVLVSQWIEDLTRLEYALEACNRTRSAIEMQREMMAISREISESSQAAEQSTILAQANSFVKQGVITQADSESLREQKELTLGGKIAIQNISKNHRIEKEFGDLISDSELKVDLAYRSLKRTEFYINEVRFQNCSEGEILPSFANGSWVTKGTEVLKVRKKSKTTDIQ